MKEIEMSCDSCGFVGSLQFNPEDFSTSDICACPFCGAAPEVEYEEE